MREATYTCRDGNIKQTNNRQLKYFKISPYLAVLEHLKQDHTLFTFHKNSPDSFVLLDQNHGVIEE